MPTIQDLNWCFSTLGCPELDLTGALDLAASHGLKRIEIRSLDMRVDMPAYFTEKWGTADKIQEQLDQRGIALASLDTSLKLIGHKPEDREAFLEFIPWAEALGVAHLRVFDGGTDAGALIPEEKAEALATINWWREQRAAGGWNVDIMVETHNAITSTAAIKEIQAALATPVAILWDSHHTWKLKGEDPSDTFDAIQDWVPHIHVKDSVPNPEKRGGTQYLMPGEGDMPLETLLVKLAEDGFDGTVSLEWERMWHTYMEPLSEALEHMQGMGWVS